jgi:GNAT superfamily N-acetyltransferase
MSRGRIGIIPAILFDISFPDHAFLWYRKYPSRREEKMSITYRKATYDDANLIAKYRITFLEELHRNMKKDEGHDIHPTVDTGDAAGEKLHQSLRSYFGKALSSGEFIAYIAEDGGKPVGFGGMVIQSIPGSFKNISGKLGYILNIYTIGSHRGKGIGSDIMKMLIDDGKSLGLGKLSLHASDMGIGIYRKLGFHEGELPELQMFL